MSGETVIKDRKGLNNLPVNSKPATIFYAEEPEGYIGLGNINQVLLRRSCAVRNIKFEILKKRKNGTVWLAVGRDRIIRFIRNMPAQTTLAARRIASNKEETKAYLNNQGVKVPRGKLINYDDIDGALLWFSQLHFKKAVVKPVSGSGGRGVTSAITSSSDLIKAVEKAGSKKVILEQHVDGSDHRLLVVGGKFTAAIRRLPAFVIGDGQSTLERLVKIKNFERSRNPYTRKTPLSLDGDVLKRIGKAGLTKDSIVPEGYRVQLQTIANIGAGGDSEDVTREVHPDFVSVAESCWHAFPDIAFCGIDLIAEDISRPVSEQDYAVIEVNSNCDIAMHHFPTYGEAIDAAGAIIDYVFPHEPMPKLYGVKVSISGKAQGVGFRDWIKNKSILYGVNGYCANMNDGTVKAVFEGSEFSVNEMILLCSKWPEKSSPPFVDFEMQAITGYRRFSIN